MNDASAAKGSTEVTIRPIRPEDEPLMVAFHHNLSDASVYLRYFQVQKLDSRIAHENLIRRCCVDYDREIALRRRPPQSPNVHPRNLGRRTPHEAVRPRRSRTRRPSRRPLPRLRPRTRTRRPPHPNRARRKNPHHRCPHPLRKRPHASSGPPLPLHLCPWQRPYLPHHHPHPRLTFHHRGARVTQATTPAHVATRLTPREEFRTELPKWEKRSPRVTSITNSSDLSHGPQSTPVS